MNARQRVGVGIIGGGLMGREAAVAISRWPALIDHPCQPELVVVCDPSPRARSWFEQHGFRTVEHHHDLLDDALVDVVYAAVPHHLHEQVYVDCLRAGKDLFAEKPFGIDLAAARRIVDEIDRSGSFVRCSSEMPFFPGAQVAVEVAASGELGEMIEARSAFLHSSDLNRNKPINWKRQRAMCGDIGVLGDLGMHAVHAPFRLGWWPLSVRAILQDLVTERPDGSGGMARCDTHENATLSCRAGSPTNTFPLTIDIKRIALGEMNTWVFEALGMDGGVSFSTRHPATVRRFRVDAAGNQVWEDLQPGHRTVHPTITGAIFEFGFTDALLQMWASFFAERAGRLDGRFGCATPQEALQSHVLFDAALRSDENDEVIRLRADSGAVRT
jgi:predicted dehydrogenase